MRKLLTILFKNGTFHKCFVAKQKCFFFWYITQKTRWFCMCVVSVKLTGIQIKQRATKTTTTKKQYQSVTQTRDDSRILIIHATDPDI